MRIEGQTSFGRGAWAGGNGAGEPGSVFGFELGEEDDVADGIGACEHHDEAVDADADAASWGHAVFEGEEEFFVDLLGFFAGLVFEALALDDGVIEFGVAWGDFDAVDDEFVDVDDGGVVGVLAGEGDEFCRDVGDEAGVEGFFFDEFFEDLLGDLVVFHGWGDFDAEFCAAGAALVRGVIEPLGVDGAEEVAVGGAVPGTGEVDGAGDVAVGVFVLDEEGADEFFCEVADEVFDEVCHLAEVCAGPVGLEHGEFGVMAAGDAFVAEVAVEFEDLGEAADEETFEVEFGGDAEEERLTEGVVEGFEGTCGGSAGDGLEHGGFDFEEAAVLEVAADFSDHAAAEDEDLAAALIGHEVEVALAVFDFAVGDAVPFIWHGSEGFGEDGEFGDLDGRFAGFGDERFAGDADPVADVDEVFEGGEGVFGDVFGVEEALEAAFEVGEVEEEGFAHVTAGGDAAGGADLEAFGEGVADFGDGVGGIEATAPWVDAGGLEFREFFAADGEERAFRFGGGWWGGWLAFHKAGGFVPRSRAKARSGRQFAIGGVGVLVEWG